jgi:hypothetical protein
MLLILFVNLFQLINFNLLELILEIIFIDYFYYQFFFFIFIFIIY